ncbi:MAG: GHMP kinase [Candidatus Nanoarchaeia archaeon]|nr:GHMP kinase [Candidatus Nanoarchaeia archaeon]
MIIESKAPTRVDLAGSTVDVGITYLFYNDPVTVNFAIDQFASVKIKTRKDKKINIISKDRNIEIDFEDITKIHNNHPLSLITRSIEFYSPRIGFDMIVDCMAPAGAGIAGSSALNVALQGALNELTKKGYTKEQLLWLGKNLETIEIRVPTGPQDYFSAMYGGVNIVHLEKDKVHTEQLNLDYKELEDRFVLLYSGKPRMSGINNWDAVRNVIDDKDNVPKKFQAIVDNARIMEKVLKNKEIDKIGEVIADEWEKRKKLSINFSSEKIEGLLRIAKENGAISGRACGAGGGGCVVIFVNKGKKQDVIKALEKECQIIDFKIAKEGLVVNLKDGL